MLCHKMMGRKCLSMNTGIVASICTFYNSCHISHIADVIVDAISTQLRNRPTLVDLTIAGLVGSYFLLI
jgi:hypothetical protein